MPELAHLGADDLSDARPTGQPNGHRDASGIGLPQNGLQKDDQEQVGHAEEQLGQPHEQGVQPLGRQAADRAVDGGHGGGEQGSQNADGQGDASAVPDAGKEIPSHGIGAKVKGAVGRLAAMSQVQISGVVGHEQVAGQTAQNDGRQHRQGHPGEPVQPVPFGGFPWGQFSGAHQGKQLRVCHRAVTSPYSSCSCPRTRGSMRSFKICARMLQKMTTTPVSIQTTMSRL